MVQIGSLIEFSDRGYEDFVSMKKNLKHYGGNKVKELIFEHNQTTPKSATAAEFSEKGGLTISDKASTALTIVLAMDTNDNAYDGAYVTGHYITNAGVKTDFVAYVNTTDSKTEVAIAADFYCWNLEDYTAKDVLVFSMEVQAGENLYIGTTGMVADAELRLATIAGGATYPVITTLFGAGDIYGLEETDTAGDVGKVITLKYWTPWGKLKEAKFTLAADTTTIVRLTDTTTGLVTVDFYRRYTMKTTATVGKYVAIGFDADKRAGTVAIDVFYGVIEEGYWASKHSRLMVPSDTYGKLYLGKIKINGSVDAKQGIMEVTYQPKDAATYITSRVIAVGSGVVEKDYAFELEPLSEVTYKVADDAATPTILSAEISNIMVYY
jgi:hypothetical protein